MLALFVVLAVGYSALVFFILRRDCSPPNSCETWPPPLSAMKLTEQQLEQRRVYNQRLKRKRELAHALIEDGFRQQARRCHPDAANCNALPIDRVIWRPTKSQTKKPK
jgi:hypothetical protein